MVCVETGDEVEVVKKVGGFEAMAIGDGRGVRCLCLIMSWLGGLMDGDKADINDI